MEHGHRYQAKEAHRPIQNLRFRPAPLNGAGPHRPCQLRARRRRRRPDRTGPQRLRRTLARAGELIEPAKRYTPEFSVLEMGEVSAEAVAEALDNLYRDPQRRQQLAQAAYDAAQNPDYTWDAVAERFDGLFAELTKRDS